MRLVTFILKSKPTEELVGAELLEEKSFVNLSAALKLTSMSKFLATGEKGLKSAEEVVQSGKFRVPIEDCRRLAPVTDPRKIICIGLNYIDHCHETGMAIPKEPVVFNKFPECVAADGDEIPLYETKALDYEVEMVIVIGKGGFRVKKEDAKGIIAGYTVAHDVSARDVQLANGGQWLLGKTMKGYAPIGPAIVTDLKDPHKLGIRCTVNGKMMQNSNTNQLVFNTYELVAYCSRFFPLSPGDLIFSGTPPGVGMGFKPPKYLKDGDVVTVEIDGIGSITNKVKELKF
uniref:Fumarylacetoacetase-like C-terminal domain-containing protein n=1 Tax=Amorphochlora amoebiformis TaxID=1561963 RepID=A0A7S0D507_9EUKA|mmetsp:Transcript_19600/g.31133  ORF Transcript_19600/g.31133 Transcript_19600/m.31133 type:complete len:288 (+) Transcript_19600:57-920(+)